MKHVILEGIWRRNPHPHVLLNCTWDELLWESRNNELNVRPAGRRLQFVHFKKGKLSYFLWSVTLWKVRCSLTSQSLCESKQAVQSPGDRWAVPTKRCFYKHRLPSDTSLQLPLCCLTAIRDSSPHTASSSLILWRKWKAGSKHISQPATSPAFSLLLLFRWLGSLTWSHENTRR